MSTIKVNSIKNTSTDDGGIAIDNSGHVQIDGQQLPTAGALSNRNLVINGAMRVAQRGTSSTSTGYLIDRYTCNFAQASITQSQQSLSSGSPYDEGFRYFHRSAVTSTSSANNAYLQLEQRIEAQNVAGSGWKYKDSSTNIVVSFWARSSLAGTYYVQYRAHDTASGLFYINKSFTLVADTWTKVEHVIPGHASLVFNDDTGVGLQITIVPHYGTDFTDSGVAVNSWFTRSGDNYLPDYAQNFTNTSSATFDVTGLQLEVGEKATPFEHRSYGDELLRCMRYFQNTNNSTSFGGGYFGTSAIPMFYFANSGASTRFYLPVRMRAAPSATVVGSVSKAGGSPATGADGTIGVYWQGAFQNNTTWTIAGQETTENSVRLQAGSLPRGASGDAGGLYFYGTSLTSTVQLSAEL